MKVGLPRVHETSRLVFILYSKMRKTGFCYRESSASIWITSPRAESHHYKHLRRSLWHHCRYNGLNSSRQQQHGCDYFEIHPAVIYLWEEKEKNRDSMLRGNTWKMAFMIFTDTHGLGKPRKNLRAPHKCCNTGSECLCVALSLLLWGYKSQVMVESSHIVACINWKGAHGSLLPWA